MFWLFLKFKVFFHTPPPLLKFRVVTMQAKFVLHRIPYKNGYMYLFRISSLRAGNGELKINNFLDGHPLRTGVMGKKPSFSAHFLITKEPETPSPIVTRIASLSPFLSLWVNFLFLFPTPRIPLSSVSGSLASFLILPLLWNLSSLFFMNSNFIRF